MNHPAFKSIAGEIAEVARGYHYHKAPEVILRVQEFIAGLWRWLQETLYNLLHIERTGASDTRVIGDLLKITLYAAGLAALICLCCVVWRRYAARQKRRAGIGGASVIEPLPDADGWRRQAAELAGAGEFRGACRAMYLCLLQVMDEEGLTQFAPARTNLEYALALSFAPSVRSGFQEMAALVESTWFGNRKATRADFEDALALVARLRPEIRSEALRKRQERQA